MRRLLVVHGVRNIFRNGIGFVASPYPCAAYQRRRDRDQIPRKFQEYQRDDNADSESRNCRPLSALRNRPPVAPVPDMRAKDVVVEQPSLQPRAATREAKGGKDDKGHCWQQRQDDTNAAQSQCDESPRKIKMPCHRTALSYKPPRRAM